MKKVLICSAFVSLMIARTSAVDLEINDLVGMANYVGAQVPFESRLSNQRQDQSAILESTGGFVAVVAETGFIGTGWRYNDPNVRNGLGSSTSGGGLSYSEPLSLRFVDPLNLNRKFTTDVVSLYTDWYGDGSLCDLRAYDVNGSEIARDFKRENGGQSSIGTKYIVSAPGIHRVTFFGSGTCAISNIQYNQPVTASQVVFPSTVTTVSGSELTGNLASLMFIDNDRYSAFQDEQTLVCSVELNSVTSILSPSSLTLVTVLSAARSGLSYDIKFYNFSTNSYYTISGGVSTSDDLSHSSTLTTSMVDYIGAAGELRASVSWRPINDEDPAQDGWLHSLNVAKWIVEP